MNKNKYRLNQKKKQKPVALFTPRVQLFVVVDTFVLPPCSIFSRIMEKNPSARFAV